MKKDWTLTQEALDRLLAWLDPDRERAGARYEAIRARLIKVFTCRGCHEAEELADETINRVTSRLFDIGEHYQGDPALFFYGVAKRVYQEYGGRRFKFTEPLPDSLPAPGSESVEAEYACLESCMEQLPRPQRDLLLQYYRDDKRAKIEGRRKLAASLGIAPNALRIRAHRIRAALHDCVRACLERHAPA